MTIIEGGQGSTAPCGAACAEKSTICTRFMMLQIRHWSSVCLLRYHASNKILITSSMELAPSPDSPTQPGNCQTQKVERLNLLNFKFDIVYMMWNLHQFLHNFFPGDPEVLSYLKTTGGIQWSPRSFQCPGFTVCNKKSAIFGSPSSF